MSPSHAPVPATETPPTASFLEGLSADDCPTAIPPAVRPSLEGDPAVRFLRTPGWLLAEGAGREGGIGDG